jgi:CHAT domain-containing protein
LSKIAEDIHTLDFVDLGPKASVDSLIAAYRGAIEGIRSPQRPSAREEADFRTFARAIYDRIWSPLFPDSMAGSNRHGPDTGAPLVLIVPDAELHRVDFNTLLSPRGKLVIEKWKTHLLSSGADPLRTSTDGDVGHDMLAAGNPDGTGAGSLVLDGDESTLTRRERIFCVDASVVTSSLPGSEVEAKTVAELFSKETGESTIVLVGAHATETRIKQEMTARRIVHLATHGFVCDESETRAYSLQEGLNDPLLMSGLIFAPVPGEDDGLLTAQEVSCLDLQRVDWVVLSACGSGLGKVVWGEGMFGLRRAFEIAGARTVVMALWRLDDTGTIRLMEKIYERRIAGASTIDAIRDAQLNRIADVRRRLNRIHPALWGGIVAEGDWR